MEKLNVDCLVLIFNELRESKKSLYSCILVNREWCHLVVPILWSNYQYILREKSRKKFSNTILSCLPTSSKQLLFDNAISLPSTVFSKPPTFNYVSLCKFLRVEIIDNIIRVVLLKQGISKNIDYLQKRELLEQEIYKLFISQCKNIKELIWRTSQHLALFPGALTCFSQLYSLNIDLHYVNSDNLYEMAQICKNLGELVIDNCSQDNPGLIFLIDIQRNLKSVSFNFLIKKGTCEGLSNAIARKGCAINNLSLDNSIDIISHSFLTSLINLKYLTIYDDCESIEGIKEFHKFLANSRLPNLQFLSIEIDLLCFKELATLIENTKGNISCISVYTYNKSVESTGMLLKAIYNHCPKIENLATYIVPSDLIYVKSLVMNCRNLINLSLILKNLNEDGDVGDELLDILTKFSSKYLAHIRISGVWNYSIDAFEKYFESYRGRKLFSFYIYEYPKGSITTEHAKIVRKYFNEGIIVNSNLKYLFN
ncbi:hypothetical protein RclHR1_03180008 [Rhizophagus clarus]|uniref:F-box domain-containing protein n=1 Tax=Rhizophagus clarus TaxID=94130 RepID=A0A2Z6R7Q1_9GLOM|nr:hypothetical protein RclHR1_03180008 [Rhizophagus clarus]GES92834.1 hypothetical protein GLOIN_2v1810914 [Rhizophagus clarus]